jgi:hypothetical protein
MIVATDIKPNGLPVLRIASFFCLLFLLGSAGCKSPQTKVEKQLGPIRAEWQTNVLTQMKPPRREVDWPAAVALMRENNLRLKQARVEITNAHHSVVQIFRDLVPTLNLRAGMSKTVQSLASSSFSDVTFSADSFFNVPGFVSMAARLYAARLYEYRTRVAYALAEREQTIALYKLFEGIQEAADSLGRLGAQKANARIMETVDPWSGKLLRSEADLRDLAWQRESKGLQQTAGDLFGNRNVEWIFKTNGLPELNYGVNPLKLSDTNRVADLQMRLVAIEYEAARAQLLGIKLRYWPELNIFVSGPPIYSRQAGTDVFWDASQVRASADVFWTIDTRGYVSRQLKETKVQQELQRERLRLDAALLVDRLLFTQKIIASTSEQLRRVRAQLKLLLAIPPAQTYFAIQQYANDYHSLTTKEVGLRRELADLNTLFWFVDDSAWPGQDLRKIDHPMTESEMHK